MVKESLKIALFCYQGFKQQEQKLHSPMGSTCFQYRGVSANFQHCPSLNLLAKRQYIVLDPRGYLNNGGIEQARLCSSKGLLRCSWCLCNFEPLFKIFGLLTTCPNFNIAFSLMSTHLSKHQQLLKVGTILLQGLV